MQVFAETQAQPSACHKQPFESAIGHADEWSGLAGWASSGKSQPASASVVINTVTIRSSPSTVPLSPHTYETDFLLHFLVRAIFGGVQKNRAEPGG